jgi:sugar lactone lactonase YvrE
VRRVDAITGIITAIAATGFNSWGYDGDGGQAIEALLLAPNGVAIDAKGNLYIADSGNNIVRVVVGATNPS